MSRSPKALNVLMNGDPVGVWYLNRGGSHLFQYDEQSITSPLARPLSLSLPIVPGNAPYRGRIVDDWFDNLLPDSKAIRDRVRRRFATSSAHAFDLLAAIGRDCGGAAQFVPADTDPGTVQTIDAHQLSESRVAQVLRGVTSSRALGIDPEEDEFRIS